MARFFGLYMETRRAHFQGAWLAGQVPRLSSIEEGMWAMIRALLLPATLALSVASVTSAQAGLLTLEDTVVV